MKNERSIILGYDEFLKMNEKAEMSREEIMKTANNLFNAWRKEYEKQRKVNDMYDKNERYNNQRKNIKEFIQKNNKFGYINSNKLLNEVDELLK